MFRFAVDLDGAVDWQSPAQLRLAGGVVSKNQMDYIHLFCENFDKHKSKTTSRGEESLSCSAVKELKKINSNLEKNKHLRCLVLLSVSISIDWFIPTLILRDLSEIFGEKDIPLSAQTTCIFADTKGDAHKQSHSKPSHFTLL